MTAKQGELGAGIPEFYAGRSVFITGGTGFIGKAVVEKLLRSCPGIGSIYLLARPKRETPAQDRIDQMMATPLFDGAKAACPGCETKVKAVPGDMTEDHLGISAANRKELAAQVSVVIHMAATIRFNEPIKVAKAFNITGLRNVIDLVKSLRQCRAFVHCSTAYTHCYKAEKVEEKFYPPTCSPEKFDSLMDILEDDNLANAVTARLTYPHPNTYTFTKCMGEEIVKTECAAIPTAVVRPAIVMPSWKEPSPGWTASVAGPLALHLAIGTGLFRVCPVKADIKPALVPVDLVTNTLIAAAWHVGMTHKDGSADVDVEPLIYHSTGTLEHRWDDLAQSCGALWHKYPLSKMAVRLPPLPLSLFAAESSPLQRWAHWFWKMSSHTLPSHLMDFAAKLAGRKPFAARAYTRIDRSLEDYKFFLTRFVDFGKAHNTRLLHELMSAEDRAAFNPLVDDMDFKEYTVNYILGIRKHIAKEDNSPKGIATARSKMKRTWWSGLAVRMIFIFIALKTGSLVGLTPKWGWMTWNSKRRNLSRQLLLVMAIGQVARSLRAYTHRTIEFIDRLAPKAADDLE